MLELHKNRYKGSRLKKSSFFEGAILRIVHGSSFNLHISCFITPMLDLAQNTSIIIKNTNGHIKLHLYKFLQIYRFQ